MSSVTKDSEALPRYRGAWLTLGWLLLLGIGVGSLWPTLPRATAGISDKFMHFAAYACLAFVFAGALQRARWPWLALALIGFGAAIELAQAGLTATRSGEWLDLAANAAGVVVGIGLVALCPGNWCRQLERAVGLGGVGQ